ncbi:hypothetical protein [Actinokineospora alba]|uniref:hypothetical protein n=1 Tax=Actinokineospora alba TaxID=504798 RepID=UPI00141512B1|nr:hypothetical protein [Actinokineospora alba]
MAGGLFENGGEVIGFLGRRPFGDKSGRILTQFPEVVGDQRRREAADELAALTQEMGLYE